MNVHQRLRLLVCKLLFWLFKTQCGSWRFISYPVRKLAELVIVLTTQRAEHKLEVLRKAVAHHTKDTQALLAECTFQPLQGTRREYVLAKKSALDEQSQHIHSALSKLQQPTIAASLLLPLLICMQGIFIKRRRSADALKRLISEADISSTFYCDVLLWLFVPCEELIGDLAEEYLLRSASEGELIARAWYREQVIRTVCHHLWKKIERLAALGTVIDYVCRLFK